MSILLGLLAFGLHGLNEQAKGSNCLLGLAVNVTATGGAKELIDSIVEEKKLGCKLMASSVKWGDLEASPSVIKIDKLRNDLANASNFGFTPVLTLQTIDTNNRTLPPDLMAEPFDSPKMLGRLEALMDAVANVLPKGPGPVMLGNEVDAYLLGHPSEVRAYETFLHSARKRLKEKRPGTSVGVTTMFGTMAANLSLVRELQDGMDLVAMTYYPLGANFQVLLVSDVGKHFGTMVQFCGNRKLYVQEAGYPAAPLLNSSEEKQAKFVDALFDTMKRQESRLYGVSYFLSIDFSDKLVDTFVKYYGLSADTFRAYLATLGLKDQFGTPRLAWPEFKKRAIEFTGGS